MQYIILFLSLLGIILSLDIDHRKTQTNSIFGEWRQINVYKRKENFYTQGLFFEDGSTLIQSGGMYKESVIAKLDYPSMEVISKTKLPDKAFAEGIARCGNYVYQLTWQEKVVYKYNISDLKLVDTLKQPKALREGWGLSNFEDHLIASDGTSNIYFLKCGSLELIRTIQVQNNDRLINNINDLTYAHNSIYANVYYSSQVLKINPGNGEVEKVYNMKNLVNYEVNKKKTLTLENLNHGDVLNGIAYNEEKDNFLLTGKRWGYFYEIEFD